MNIIVFSKVFLALIVHPCVTAIITPTSKAQHLTQLYETGIDIMMTCYEDPPRTVGIVGDSDGSIHRALRSKYLIPVVSTDKTKTTDDIPTTPITQHLEFFVIASASPRKLSQLFFALKDSIWWNRHANFLILHTTPDLDNQCSYAERYMYITNVREGLLNTVFICYDRKMGIVMYNANPFTDYAPNTWTYISEYKARYTPSFYVYQRVYQKGGENCEDINFSKTINIGRYELQFIIRNAGIIFGFKNGCAKIRPRFANAGEIVKYFVCTEHMWFVKNIIMALNASATITNEDPMNAGIIYVLPYMLSDPLFYASRNFDTIIISHRQVQLFAVSQHTAHKTQLEKIITVIDRESRIGVAIVYLVTFMFFKFFLRQAIVPAILDLVRLTCNTGLAKLPKNVAPTVYLACLFAFVITLQGIYTGNLASLLTTTIAYPNVNTKEDIAKLGYTPYTYEFSYSRLASDPEFGERVLTVPSSEMSRQGCIKYVLNDPLATCVLDYSQALLAAIKWNLHISRHPILAEYVFYQISTDNPLGRRLQGLILLWTENGLRYEDERLLNVMLQFVDDDAVKQNTVRRIMTLNDLMFAFLILIVGVACSLICFISELVIFRIRLKMRKRRDRTRARLAWEPPETNWFSSLNFRFHARRLFSKRR